MTSLADIAAVRRTGPLIDASASHADLIDMIRRAGIETGDDAFHFRTGSATEAAAWLLGGAHANALGDGLGSAPAKTPDLPHLFGLNRLLGFRGQQAKYDAIIPSQFRRSEDEQILHLRAGAWFSTAISAWHNSSFRYSDGQLDTFGVERATATGIAQHYGLVTDFVDWTWDPLVAMIFALAGAKPGDLVSVFIRPFGPGSRPHEAYNVFLPPSFAVRAWRQRGFFSWQPVAPQYFDDLGVRLIDGAFNKERSRAASHHRVSFPATAEDIAWAKPRLDALYNEEFGQLLELVDWSLKAAANSHRSPRSLMWRDRNFIAECERLKIDPPTLFTTSPPATATRENIPEMMDYMEMMALRQRPRGGLAYHKPALLTALVALPRKSFANVASSDAATRDKRSVALLPDPVRLDRLRDEVQSFDPAQDLLAPSDTYFVDAHEFSGTIPTE